LDYAADGIFGNYNTTVIGLGLTFLNLLTSLLGGFFLAYSLIWRHLEKPMRRKNMSKMLFLYVLALTVVITDMYLIIIYNFKTPFVFFSAAIIVLLLAFYLNNKYHKHSKDINPFLSLVGLGLGVYIVLFIENLIIERLFTVHYYAMGIAAIFTVAFLYHVIRLSR
jgi:hypothetical protein